MPLKSAAPPAASHVLLERFGDEYEVWGYQNVSVVLWHGTPSVQGIDGFNRLLPRRLKQTGASRMSVVHVSLAPTKLPGVEARAALADVSRRWRRQVGAVAVVVEYDGFLGSAVRGLATSVVVLSGQRFTMRVASRVGEVAAWLPEPHLRETGVTLDPAELYDALSEIRAQAGDASSAVNG